MTPEFLFELKRQGMHIFAGLIMAFLVYVLKPILGAYIIIPMLTIIFFLWFAPRVKAPMVKHLINHLERTEDIKKFPFKGAFWYNVGITFPIVFLTKELGAAIIIIFCLGDGTATLVGRFYGKHKLGLKSIEGFTSFVVFGTLGTLVLLDFKTAVVLALLGGVIELSSRFNDNLTIPLGLTAASLILGL